MFLALLINMCSLVWIIMRHIRVIFVLLAVILSVVIAVRHCGTKNKKKEKKKDQALKRWIQSR